MRQDPRPLTDDVTPGQGGGQALVAAAAPSAAWRSSVGEPIAPREIGRFASFALAMSTICILAGGITSFHVGFCSVGGASIGLGWPLCCLFSLAVALTMGQVASAFPRAGGPCEWAAELGGAGWGWFAGCCNLAGLVTALAAVNLGLCQFVVAGLSTALNYDPARLPSWIIAVLLIATTASQSLINHWGIRLTTLLTDFSGYLIAVVALALTLLLLAGATGSDGGLAPSRLVEFANFSGPAGDNVWPAQSNVAWLFALGLLLPAYTMTGFDVSAQTAEETRDPERTVPRAIWRAVLISGLAGWIMLSAVVLAARDLREAAAAGEQSFFHIVDAATPWWTHGVFYAAISVAQYFCGLACVTAASRLAWAMARDGGLPLARWLRRIGSHRTPSMAIWTVCVVTLLFGVFVSYATIAAVCAVFMYIAYVVPTACGLARLGRWPRTGPWHLGRWYAPLAVVCVLGCVALIILGMQPPNEIAAVVVGGTGAVLLALWFGYFRRSFRAGFHGLTPQRESPAGP
jgi:amino acid transporter